MRYVEAGTGCGRSVQVLDYEANDKFISCELGISPDCTEDAVVLLQGPFWDCRLGGHYCFACQECYEAHEPECRGNFGMHREGR